MIQSLWISATGMSAQQLNMDTISNNLANVNTTGFKSGRAQFADLFSQQLKPTEAEDGQAAVAVGLGTQNTAIDRSFTQGTVENTGNSLDLAIQGEGFFQILKPDGTLAYTRDGTLKVSSDSILCTSQGYPLTPEIRIPEDALEISIGTDGTVAVKCSGDSTAKTIAQLELTRFVNPAGLSSEGQNMFTATAAAGETIVNTPGQDGLGSITQGALERSNVNLVVEMVNMILTQRAYEVNTKAIQATDEMIKMANNLRRA